MKSVIGIVFLLCGFAGPVSAAFVPPGPPPEATGQNIGYMGDLIAGLPFGLGNIGTHRRYEGDPALPMTHDLSRFDPNNEEVTHWYSFTVTEDRYLSYFLEAGEDVSSIKLSFFDSSGTEQFGPQSVDLMPHDYVSLNFIIAAGDPWWMKVVGIAGGELETYTVKLSGTPVPLPPAILLFGSAIAGFSLLGRKKKAVS